ncbi:hypothetical protein [Apibacter adventoris]|uniref:hypothetical protein n=1 Tax=Apibacter adventoris TaxID=1679466 RepID=UPI0015E48BAF|nr:hypothetical protein [Apibacter adventoris]
MKKDSVIYQKKKNKIMIDLDTSIYTYASGKICKEKMVYFIVILGPLKSVI